MQHSTWRAVGTTAATLAAAMGVGRFAFTPILPLMVSGAGLTAASGAELATINLVGYLVGAVIGIIAPRLTRSRLALRAVLIVLVLSLALMPVTHAFALWAVLRFVTGVASAVLFVIAVASLQSQLRGQGAHLIGWGFGGVGAGIAISGALVLVLREFTNWASAWIAVAALAAVLGFFGWFLVPERVPGVQVADARAGRAERTGQSFAWAAVSYGLEGVGYIIAGTFLVAAIDENASGWVGDGAWVVVGLAAVPSTVLWGRLSARFTRPSLLVVALLVQAIGVALPALVPGIAPALVSAVLFGGTFIGITSLALGIGNELGFPRAIAVMTTGYSVGQIAGPIIVTPLVGGGYSVALLLAAAVLLVGAATALVLRLGYPRRLAVAR
ncbi:YbfB/YjiJ family MFS transporter [Gryllotalpicola reticulitermitis]|uniref:YbfB/YjiJ family MFS transporter n=1 Tax=Gryllotalpicola reticulitermitis TaxID=1184153 RepID=A0ABV8QAC1_9MICO